MRKFLLPAIALLALSACGHKAKNEAAEANESLAGDSNTMAEAVADVNAANAAAAGPVDGDLGNGAEAPPPGGSGDEGDDANANEITD